MDCDDDENYYTWEQVEEILARGLSPGLPYPGLDPELMDAMEDGEHPIEYGGCPRCGTEIEVVDFPNHAEVLCLNCEEIFEVDLLSCLSCGMPIPRCCCDDAGGWLEVGYERDSALGGMFRTTQLRYQYLRPVIPPTTYGRLDTLVSEREVNPAVLGVLRAGYTTPHLIADARWTPLLWLPAVRPEDLRAWEVTALVLALDHANAVVHISSGSSSLERLAQSSLHRWRHDPENTVVPVLAHLPLLNGRGGPDLGLMDEIVACAWIHPAVSPHRVWTEREFLRQRDADYIRTAPLPIRYDARSQEVLPGFLGDAASPEVALTLEVNRVHNLASLDTRSTRAQREIEDLFSDFAIHERLPYLFGRWFPAKGNAAWNDADAYVRRGLRMETPGELNPPQEDLDWEAARWGPAPLL